MNLFEPLSLLIAKIAIDLFVLYSFALVCYRFGQFLFMYAEAKYLDWKECRGCKENDCR